MDKDRLKIVADLANEQRRLETRQLIVTLIHATVVPLALLLVGLSLIPGVEDLSLKQLGLVLCGFANAWAAFYCGWYLRKTWAK